MDEHIRDSLWPIRGDFITVSPLSRPQSSSPSPQKPLPATPNNINAIKSDLAEKQMKQMDVSTISRKPIGQPSKASSGDTIGCNPGNLERISHPRGDQQRSSASNNTATKPPPMSLSLSLPRQHIGNDRSVQEKPLPQINSSPKSHSSPYVRRTLAERRQHETPMKLKLNSQPAHPAMGSEVAGRTKRPQVDARPQTPDMPAASPDNEGWESESVYSDGGSSSARVSPLKLHPKKAAVEGGKKNEEKDEEEEGEGEDAEDDNSIFQNYHDWKKSIFTNPVYPTTDHLAVPGLTSNLMLGPETGAGAEAGVGPATETEAGLDTHAVKGPDATEPGKPMAPQREVLYSPLTPYFANNKQPTTKKGSKVLIGQNGWLERTGRTPEKRQDRKKGMLDSLKRMAKDMTTSTRRPREDSKGKSGLSNIAISLDPREQSLLYCELEFYLSCAIHGYITVQLNYGRLDPDKLKKIADSWVQKGRPKVVGFRYDLETQLELISLHSNEFRFYGCRQANEAEVTGLLHTMKVNARAMRIRTFCQPDSVIAKQLVDAQSFFNLLGVPEIQQIALHQVSQFFKVIVEREQQKVTRLEHDRAQAVSDLVSYQWERAACESQNNKKQ